MNVLRLLQRTGMDILKGMAAGVAALLGLVAGGMITGLLRLPAPVMPVQASLVRLLPLMFLSEIIIAILLGESFRNLLLPYWKRMLGLWLCNYLLYFLLTTLDGMLYTPVKNSSTSVLSDLFPALFFSLVVAGLWRPEKGHSLVEQRPATLFNLHKPGSWVWRLGLAWLAYPVIYYLAGRITAIFTLHYYQDPSLNLGTILPSIGAILAMQILRSFLFILAVLPLLFSWRGSRGALFLLMGAIIYIQIAATPILQGYWLPLLMRIPHACELFLDSYLQALIYTSLFFLPAKEGLERLSLAAESRTQEKRLAREGIEGSHG